MRSQEVWPALARVRDKAPLVQNITNYVVMNSTANALLALGASPAMVHAVEEVRDFSAMISALVVNIGTLSSPWLAGMKMAVDAARSNGVPWALDPVAAGALPWRTAAAHELMRAGPAVIRGNASEIRALAGLTDGGKRGADSLHGSDAAVEAAGALARSLGTVVAVTGTVDYVTDGDGVTAIANGHPMMARVTGLGCAATAIIGAFLGARLPPLGAAVAGLAVIAVAGELAAETSPGPGTLQVRLLDALYTMDRETLDERVRLQ